MSRLWTVIAVTFSAVLLTVLLSYRKGRVGSLPETTDPATLFRQVCAQCHGATGEGLTNIAPPLRGRSLPIASIKETIQRGRGRMPAQPLIRGEILEELAGYVAGLR